MKNGSWEKSLWLLAFWMVGVLQMNAQALQLKNNVSFYQEGQTISSPFAGGLNLPQFSTIDLDGDSKLDLFVFDRSGNKVLTFLNTGQTGSPVYTYDPTYLAAFPDNLEDFALLRDMNCDGLPDIFTNFNNYLKIFENVGSNGNHSFQFLLDTLESDRGMGPAPMYVFYEDIPALEDVDMDGDLDILTFDAAGAYIEWHRNTAIENGNCNQFALELADACWGKFYESALNNQIFLNATCKGGGSGSPDPLSGLHGGSTVSAFDEDSDGDLDLYIGDLLYNGITFLHNGDTSNSAHIDSVDYFFPSYDTQVDMWLFPAIYFLDADDDGLTDALVAPNAGNVSIDFDNVWFYKNTGSSSQAVFNLNRRDFLVDQMVDVGRASNPVFFDHNNDGLLDLIIGNFSYKLSQSISKPALTYYENTGTATNPEYTLRTRDYMGLSSSFNPTVYGYHPTFGDLDNDGDADMILGEYTGKIHFFENISAPGDSARFILAASEYKGIDVGQFAAPQLVDINRDGKLDLIIGETGGNLNYYENIGTASQADFSSTATDEKWGNAFSNPDCCQGYSVPFVFEEDNLHYSLMIASEDGNIKYFQDIENGDTTFALTDSLYGEIKEGVRTSIHGADIDGDNKFEWVVGNLRGGIAIYESDIFVQVSETQVLDDIKVYPNPSHDRVFVDFPGGKSLEMALYDLQGRQVASQSRVNSGASLDLRDLPAGLYLLKIQDPQSGLEKVHKIVKE